MKNAYQIKQEYKGLQTRTYGKGNFYTCEVIFQNGETLKGIGSTLENAEDTAWYAVKINKR